MAEDELIAAGDPGRPQEWCKFHLPLTTDSGETLKAGWGPAEIHDFREAVLAHIGAARNENRVVDLSGVVFPPRIDLRDPRGRMNLPEVSFLEATFGGDIAFRNVTFGGDTNFSGVKFGGRADFRGVSFQRNAFFESAVFAGVTEFRAATFSRAARFKKARFNGVTTFHGATFEFLAEFEQTRFCKGVTFDEAAFGGEANFEKAEFDGDAKFFGDPTREGPTGRADIFRRSVAFRAARFKGQAIFTNRRFLDKTDFRNAIFTVAPEFHDCTLHQGTSFAGARFLDRKGTQEVDAVSAYRTLKLKMAGMRATDEEALFYGLEQRSLRADPDTPGLVKLFS